MYTSSTATPSNLSGLLYRYGFLISESLPTAPAYSTWNSRAVGLTWLVSHPETRIFSATAGDRTVVIVGSAFDPEEHVFDEAAIVKMMLEAFSNTDKFNLCLDRLAGRFALLVASATGTEVYHDAMGSRSLFYSVAGPAIVASHAEIVAELSGAPMADYFIPFITSRNYIQRDVKYLPGLLSPYNDVLQLTPNTKLIFGPQTVERYWPREDKPQPVAREESVAFLCEHLEGLAQYLRIRRSRPFAGLTAGTDSRGVFAAVKDLDPFLFTYVRSEKGDIVAAKDARVAQSIADSYGLFVNVWGIPNRQPLKSVDNEFSYAYRRSTGYYRGPGSAWLKALYDVAYDANDGIFIRGFGGEIMRGFYQEKSKRLTRINVSQVSDVYDVNAGAPVTRNAFGDMIDRTGLNDKSIAGYDPNDVFYWEHRMGTWGSMSMTEADLALSSMVAYNSRNLYAMFMALNPAERESRIAFELASSRLAPALKGRNFS